MSAVHEYVYECPDTGFQVQAASSLGDAPNDREVLEAVWCRACGKMHLVNPATGRVRSRDDRS